MSTNSAPSLRLEPRSPRLAVAALLALAFMAAGAIGLSGLSLAPSLLLWLLAGLLLAQGLVALLQPCAVLEWDTAGQWWLHGDSEGRALQVFPAATHDIAGRADPAAAELLGAARLGPLLLLRLRVAGRRRVLVLTPDRLPADQLRRLRVRLGVG